MLQMTLSPLNKSRATYRQIAARLPMRPHGHLSRASNKTQRQPPQGITLSWVKTHLEHPLMWFNNDRMQAHIMMLEIIEKATKIHFHYRGTVLLSIVVSTKKEGLCSVVQVHLIDRHKIQERPHTLPMVGCSTNVLCMIRHHHSVTTYLESRPTMCRPNNNWSFIFQRCF